MTRVATVERIINHTYAEVSILREAVCGHDCEKCGGCGAESITMIVQAENPLDAQPGERVIVESNTAEAMYIVALVYSLPTMALVLGGVITSLFTSATGIQIAAATVCMALALIPAKRYGRLLEERGKTSFIITKLLT